jgi:3,4-dihydroxy-2-butanone 4-phosphate synthase
MPQSREMLHVVHKRPQEFAKIEDAIAAMRAGEMVIVADDEDRENEGDLTMAAEKITPEAINFMAKHGRGLIRLAMTPERLDELEFRSWCRIMDHDSKLRFVLALRRRTVRPPESRPRTVRPQFGRRSIRRRGLPT